MDSLKISNEASSDGDSTEERDWYHEELLRSALGPRGAQIFRSPVLEANRLPLANPIASNLTGTSNCHKCGKRCKLAQRFQCKCGQTFCPQHRYYDQHACSFDVQARERERVQAANPKVVKDKIGDRI